MEARIGVPDAERAVAQPLWITLRLEPAQGFRGLGDDIRATIDYHAVAVAVADLARSRPRRLIETLGTEIADSLLSSWPLAAVAVTVEKHILPDTDFVAIHLERRR